MWKTLGVGNIFSIFNFEIILLYFYYYKKLQGIKSFGIIFSIIFKFFLFVILKNMAYVRPSAKGN
jgi:hypothetical protein